MTADPYSRFYWRFIDEYPDIYDDERTLGCWLRLLVLAEMAHPTTPQLPRSVRKSSLSALVDADLVVVLPGNRYRVRGLDAERERRSEAGRIGGLASGRVRRSNSEQLTNGRSTNVQRSANEIEPSKDEQSKAKTRRATRANGSFDPAKETVEDYQARLAKITEERLLGGKH